jgi:CBS domain-containing protein
VCGLVGVMDLIYGCGGAEGWRSLFDKTMGMGDDGTASVGSHSHKGSSIISKPISTKTSTKAFKPVSKLRPRKPALFMDDMTVYDICKGLTKKRATAALITDAGSELVGIITDHDITRRVVARHLDANETNVASVMTKNLHVVLSEDSAMEALSIMIDNHYRYLPVMDSNGSIGGILDIGKCLDDAITKLERSVQKKNKKPSAEEYLNQVSSLQGVGANQANMLAALLGPIMSQAFNETSSPTLDTLLAGKPTNSTSVSPTSSILVAGIVMAEHHKAALVVDNGVLLGIVSFKDIMSRAIANQLPLDSTVVTDIMTPNPEVVSPQTTIVEALQIMHENKFLTLPVCDDDGMICGVIDVMDLIYGCGGSEGWRSIFENAMDMDDISDQASIHSSSVHSSHMPMPVFAENKMEPVILVNANSPYATAQLNNVPNQVIFKSGTDDGQSLADTSMLDRTLSYPNDQNNASAASPGRTAKSLGDAAFKVVDDEGHTYLVRSDGNYANFIKALSLKVKKELDPKQIKLNYTDEDGDLILISSDDCLGEAIAITQKQGTKAVKITLSTLSKTSSSSGNDNKLMAIAGGSAAILVGIVAMALMKSKK